MMTLILNFDRSTALGSVRRTFIFRFRKLLAFWLFFIKCLHIASSKRKQFCVKLYKKKNPGSNLGWHSQQPVHSPTGPRSYSCSGSLCINQSIVERVSAESGSFSVRQYWHVSMTRHPSGCLTCFWAQASTIHQSLTLINLISINKPHFQTHRGVNMQEDGISDDLIQGHAKTRLQWNLAFW